MTKVVVKESLINGLGAFSSGNIPNGEVTLAIDDFRIVAPALPMDKSSCGNRRCRKTTHSAFFHLPYNLQVEYLPLLDRWYIEENK